MRLTTIAQTLESRGITYEYHEEDGCGSLDFLYRGVPYHVWEFRDGDEWGAETNVRQAGKFEDLTGDYEAEIAALLAQWS